MFNNVSISSDAVLPELPGLLGSMPTTIESTVKTPAGPTVALLAPTPYEEHPTVRPGLPWAWGFCSYQGCDGEN